MLPLAREDALTGLCRLPMLNLRELREVFFDRGYIVYECPRCGGKHQAFDSPRLREMLEWFPDSEVIEANT
jgi:hypothetical protein